MTWQLSQDYKGKFELIKRVLDAENCKNVLDIGCNAGAITNLFGEAGYFAVGVDQNVDCNGKHSKACIGEFKLMLENIERLPKFDAILLLSVWHQIFATNGEIYAIDFIKALLQKCNTLIIELAGIPTKYGYANLFEPNNDESLKWWFTYGLSRIFNIEFISKTKHNSVEEPYRYLFKLSQKCL